MRYLLLLMLLLLPGVLALEWSELLFNPVGNDNSKEFVELVGTENLTGCMIHDRKSKDPLVLERSGTDVILILETNSSVEEQAREAGATVYTAGNAIGNGLDNTYEELNITCTNTTLLSTAYNVSMIKNFSEGHSILYVDGKWVLGPMNGTPGRREPTQNDTSPNATGNNSSNTTFIIEQREEKECNPALSILLSRTTVQPEDRILFTILSEHPASFTVTAENATRNWTLLEGDTLLLREYGVTVPPAERLRFSASQEACGAKQRTARVVKVTQPKITQPGSVNETAQNTSQELTTAVKTVDTTLSVPSPAENVTEDSTSAPSAATARVTATVVMDKDRSAVVWVAAFGIGVLALAALVFRHAVRKGEL